MQPLCLFLRVLPHRQPPAVPQHPASFYRSCLLFPPVSFRAPLPYAGRPVISVRSVFFPFCAVQKGDIDSLSHFCPIHKRLNFVLMVPLQTFMELSHPFSSCILCKTKEAAPRSPEALPLFEHDLYSAVSSTTTYTPAGMQAAHAPSLSSQPNCSHTWSGH